MKTPFPLKSAWLISWESDGEHARVKDDEKVAAVLNYRWTGRQVREFVEQLYASLKYSPSEKVRIARKALDNPYPAQFGTVDGVPWDAEVLCGHNPWLRARRVTNLRLAIVEDGVHCLQWDELPRPEDTLEALRELR
jgi:hypothetical protein